MFWLALEVLQPENGKCMFYGYMYTHFCIHVDVLPFQADGVLTKLCLKIFGDLKAMNFDICFIRKPHLWAFNCSLIKVFHPQNWNCMCQTFQTHTKLKWNSDMFIEQEYSYLVPWHCRENWDFFLQFLCGHIKIRALTFMRPIFRTIWKWKRSSSKMMLF